MAEKEPGTDFPSLSRTQALILELLLDVGRPMYGLELVKAAGSHLKRGTVYVTLDRMEDKGFIESRREADAGDGPVRRVYLPTGLGQRVLAAREVYRLTVTRAL